MLRPELSDDALAEELADYFVRITDEFKPIEIRDLPTTYSAPFKILGPDEVAERIRSGKKPKSGVKGDVLPSLTNAYSEGLVIPTTRIINFAIQDRVWPGPWLIETQSGIPKSETCSSYDQLRNLSCTNVLSKVMESFILEKLQAEVTLRPNQSSAPSIPSSNAWTILALLCQ